MARRNWLSIVTLFVIGAAAPTAAHVDLHGTPFPAYEIPDELLQRIDVRDGTLWDWAQLFAPSLTAVDFYADPTVGDGAQFDGADLDFRIWLGWSASTSRIYVGVERLDDVYINGYEGGGDFGQMWRHDGVEFMVDGDHSGGQYNGFGSDDCRGCSDDELRRMSHITAQSYLGLADVPDGRHVGSLALPDWANAPPYANGGGRSEGLGPTRSVIEFYVTPFDSVARDDPAASRISRLDSGKVIGFSMNLPDFDTTPSAYHAFHTLSGACSSWRYARCFTDAVLVGGGGTPSPSGVHVGDVVLDAPGEIAGLANWHEGAFRIQGNLRIDGPDLVDLRGLERLIAVDGNVYIQVSPGLSNLRGLEGLTSIGGELRIVLTEGLRDLEGLEGLATVGGNVTVLYNRELETLRGLSSLVQIGGHLVIRENARLSALEGPESLQTVDGNLEIEQNPALRSLAGLEPLQRIGETLWVWDNEALATLEGLSGLEEVPRIEVRFNPVLGDLRGLRNVHRVQAMIVSGNPSLCTIDGLQGLEEADTLSINGSPACSAAPLSALRRVDGQLQLRSGFTSLEGLGQLRTVGELLLEDTHLTSLDGLMPPDSLGSLRIAWRI